MASSTLPASALQASKAALSAALAENEIKVAGNGDAPLEEGEIQEVDMQAQAENIRTVFNDPKNFNVKVCFPLSATVPVRLRRPHCPRPSTRCSRHGPSGSTHRRPRVAICRKPP